MKTGMGNRLKNLICLLLPVSMLASMLAACVSEPTEPLYYEIQSPDGVLKVEITIDSTISLQINDTSGTVADIPDIYVRLSDGRAFGLPDEDGSGMLPLKDVNSVSVDRVVKAPFHRNSTALMKYNGADFVFKGYGLRLRVFNDGVAYRFFTKKSRFGIISENAVFAVPGAELPCGMSSEPEADSSMGSPLFVRAGNRNILIGDGDIGSYPRMSFVCDGKDFRGVFPSILAGSGKVMAYSVKACELPWRIIGYADDRSLLSSDLNYLLGGKSEIRRTDWIRPGKSLVPSSDTVLLQTIDMAAKYGFEYVTADAAAANLDCAIAHADSVGVGIILHLHRKADYEGCNPERIFRKYASMGIKGVKLDFRGAADFLSSQKLEAICSAAADAGLVLDLQGVVSPGLNRKYPNVLNCGSLPDVPDRNVSKSQAARRQLGGDNLAAMWAEAARHWDCGTESRRLAEFVILDSPLAEFRCGTDSDRDSLYMDFVSSIPTAFDRTLPLEVVPGKMVVNSRKKGKLRYVAGMNSDEAAEYVLYMDKIIAPGENYKVTMFSDTEGTGEKGGYVVREFKVNAFDKIKIRMAPGGGFVMRLVPVGRQ